MQEEAFLNKFVSFIATDMMTSPNLKKTAESLRAKLQDMIKESVLLFTFIKPLVFILHNRMVWSNESIAISSRWLMLFIFKPNYQSGFRVSAFLLLPFLLTICLHHCYKVKPHMKLCSPNHLHTFISKFSDAFVMPRILLKTVASLVHVLLLVYF